MEKRTWTLAWAWAWACLLILAGIPTGEAFGAAVAGVGAAAAPLTADQIVAASLEARGGAARIRALRSARVRGTLRLHPGMEAPFTFEWRRPNSVRLEYEIQGMRAVQVFDGQSGWAIAPFHGNRSAERLTGASLRRLADSADFEGALLDWRAKGHALEYLGVEAVEGTAAHKLKLTLGSGTVRWIYLDVETYLEIYQVSRLGAEGGDDGEGDEMGEETEATSSDYKSVNGLLFAFSRDRRPKGALVGQLQTVESIELDVDLPADRFAMPPAGP